MKRALLCITVLILSSCGLACGKSPEEQAREDVDQEMARRGETVGEPEKPAVAPAPLPATPKKDEKPADPEPTTPEEIDQARKKAMIDGRDKDVIKYCEMAKPGDKSDPQVLLGCTLAACRLSDVDRARAWATPLAKSKPLMEQAKKVCTANKVPI